MSQPAAKPMPNNDIIITSLKARYWDLIKKEVIGSTPKITAELDRIEEAIRELSGK